MLLEIRFNLILSVKHNPYVKKKKKKINKLNVKWSLHHKAGSWLWLNSSRKEFNMESDHKTFRKQSLPSSVCLTESEGLKNGLINKPMEELVVLNKW